MRSIATQFDKLTAGGFDTPKAGREANPALSGVSCATNAREQRVLCVFSHPRFDRTLILPGKPTFFSIFSNSLSPFLISGF